MFKEISFPEHEYESIQNYLNKQGYCYTTRVYKEVGKYKEGELYTAPWGDVLQIDEVKTYRKVSERPFYDEMSEDEKMEIYKYSEEMGLPYEFIKFSRSTGMNKKVIVVPYDESWKSAFEEIKKEIKDAIGDLIIGIEHVGSTSVEGLSAKPCIDIDVIIEDYGVFGSVVSKLAMIGYMHEGNLGIKDREAFRYSDKPHLQKHHLYVCPQQSEELYRHITFRDFLRSNPEAVRKYGLTKETAARLYPDDIEKYMEYKAPCIEELYKMCGLES